MDLNTIDAVIRPGARGELPGWRAGDAWLAGGTWLFSEPQPALRRLIDLSGLGWEPYEVGPGGLSLAATCTIARLNRLEPPAAWTAASLIGQCCRALLGSFKIWNVATVGGNLCMALPAGPMAALATALDGACTIWTPCGGERALAAADFVLGPQRTALRPGEVLRALHLPAAALERRTAFRRISLSPNGRSAALLIGTLDARDGRFSLTVTASTRRPVRIDLPRCPDAGGLREAIAAAVGADLWYDDVHGAPDWREHVTHLLADEIRAELRGDGAR
jgi:CO/xanthine dehydrogenase FAD-binding subunit